MKISVVTMFPELFESPLGVSLVGRALEDGLVTVDIVDLRQWGSGVHRKLDDAPFGGGAGMVMMIGPIHEALQSIGPSHRVLLAAAGTPLTQATLDRWSGLDHIALVCGRYEGVDERVAEHLIDEEVTLGDYVLLGGEVGALAIIEGIVRLLPGVVGNPESIEHESFRHGLLEEPHYTRPARYGDWAVPDVLLSGDHAKIAEWRAQQRLDRTDQRRPDLTAPQDEP